MPWQETDPLGQRRKFVKDLKSGPWTMSGLCDRYGIGRKTGYKLVHRVEDGGAAGLDDRSRAPHSGPHRTPSDVEELVLAAKQAHPSWGARKLLTWLHRRHPRRTLPARSTVADLLARSGWVKPRRTRRRWKHPGRPEGEPKAANDLWTADFKGGSSARATALGATRSRSPTRRAATCCAARPCRTCGPREPNPCSSGCFREVGLPRAMRTDNGAPFASTGIHGPAGFEPARAAARVRPLPPRVRRGVRLVSNAGCFRWHAPQIFVSQALAQEWIGLEEVEDGVWSVHYQDVLIARLDERTFKLSA